MTVDNSLHAARFWIVWPPPLWRLIWLVAVVVLLPFSGLAAAQGDERLAFLDEAPLAFDLSQPRGATQTVEVVNGDTKYCRMEVRAWLGAGWWAAAPARRWGR